MRYLSVCSGIEAATVAWGPLGWEALAFAEIDAFPSAVLDYHYPTVPNLGDMENHIDWRLSDLDVLVGGTPCQSFSVAGLREGMADPRGNLALVYLAIADQLRPRWLVWENVPGVLSSNNGRDFGAYLGALGQLGYGWAYRVLDAQHFGVPQRRRRVFVVGYLGDWGRAAAVLFERESLRRNPAPSREAGQDVAPALAARTKGGGGLGTDLELDGGLISKALKTRIAGGSHDPTQDTYITGAHTLRGEGHDASEDGTGRGTPLVADPISSREGATYTHEGKNNFRLHNVVAAPLTAGGAPNSNAPGRRKEDDENLVACFDETQITHRENRSTARPDTAALAEGARPPSIAMPSTLRRLTPRECERLQGFPDDYTLIRYNGKPAKDTPRYRALGNSMAVPVMRWIGERLQQVKNIKEANCA